MCGALTAITPLTTPPYPIYTTNPHTPQSQVHHLEQGEVRLLTTAFSARTRPGASTRQSKGKGKGKGKQGEPSPVSCHVPLLKAVNKAMDEVCGQLCAKVGAGGGGEADAGWEGAGGGRRGGLLSLDTGLEGGGRRGVRRRWLWC